MLDPARPVRVFRNWKHHCWTIMQGGVLCASARQVRLADVAFRVRESGRQRMLRGHRKNVHAYAVGRLVDWVHPDDGRELDALEGRSVPQWLEIDKDAFTGTVKALPTREDITLPIQEQLIVELYSGSR